MTPERARELRDAVFSMEHRGGARSLHRPSTLG
jgi:hypothetical protein